MSTIRVQPVAPAPAGYDIIIDGGALDNLPHLLANHARAARYVIITDDVVDELHAQRILHRLREAGLDIVLYAFPPGEPYKTRDVWAHLSDRMCEDGVGRDACVIAVGGGVVGDVGGFVASTYLRGVPCVHVPTTLLSMLDASIGGKTGVDTRYGKNLIGSFHQPALVVMDPSVVWTQDHADMMAGAAEAVKHGAILDPVYLAWIGERADALKHSDTGILTQLVRKSVEIKAGVVSRDMHEQGERAILNFGHTIGHALEQATQYRMSHGHAVARGMIAEAMIGEQAGITAPGTGAQIRDALHALGLPADVTSGLPADVNVTEIERFAAADKKNRGGRTRFVLLETIGKVARPPGGDWTWDVPVDYGAL